MLEVGSVVGRLKSDKQEDEFHQLVDKICWHCFPRKVMMKASKKLAIQKRFSSTPPQKAQVMEILFLFAVNFAANE